jgi:hypothetical protein
VRRTFGERDVDDQRSVGVERVVVGLVAVEDAAVELTREVAGVFVLLVLMHHQREQVRRCKQSRPGDTAMVQREPTR